MDININKFTGVNFILVFPKLPYHGNDWNNKPLMLNIFSSTIPSISLQELTNKWLGSSAKFQIGEVTWGDWNINFVVDSKLENWKSLYKWIVYINNNKDNFKIKPEDYQIDVTMLVMDNFENVYMKILFKNVWIQTLGNIEVSYREGGNIVESSATLLYDRFELQ